MNRYAPIFALFLFTAIAFHSAAFAACDPQSDNTCCSKDSDCTMYVDPSHCVFLAMNKVAADKLEKENPPPSAECKPESVEKLKMNAKTKRPVCISHGCDFE